MKTLLMAAALFVGSALFMFSSSGCVGAQVEGRAAYAHPSLAYVQPGLWVVAGASDPLFYADGWYWLHQDGYWYRSTSFRGGWAYAPRTRLPVVIRSIQRPRRYTHYRPRAGQRTWRAPVVRRRSSATRRGTEPYRRGPDARRRGSEIYRGPDVRRRGPDMRRRGPDMRRRGPDTRRRGPDTRRRGPDTRRPPARRGYRNPRQSGTSGMENEVVPNPVDSASSSTAQVEEIQSAHTAEGN
jgi:hypothetical protein